MILQHPDQAEAYHRLLLANLARLARWESWAAEPTEVDGTRAFLQEAAREWAEGRRVPGTIAVPAGDGWRPVGSAGLRVNAYEGSGELGYWIDGDFEGQGLVTRAAIVLLDHAFGLLGLARVAILTSADNERSAAVARRLGFAEEGRVRQARPLGDGRTDDAVFGLLADEWPAARQALGVE